MTPKLSVVVPIFNAQNALGACLNSVVNQSFYDIEIIAVDDGSTDKSLEICQNYAKLDSRVHIIAQKNAGVSMARNAGIKAAKGEYIQFLDSDDILAQNACEALLEAMQNNEADLVICGFQQLQRNGKWAEKKAVIKTEYAVITGEIFLEQLPMLFTKTGVMEAPFNKLFRRDLIIKNKLTFEETVSFGEDMLFNLAYNSCVKKVIIIAEILYFYAVDCEESLSRKYSENLLQKKLILYEKLKQTVMQGKRLTPESEYYLRQYKAASILNGLAMLYHNSCTLTFAQKVAYISPLIIEDSLGTTFEAAIMMDPAFAKLLPYAKEKDAKALLLELEQVLAQPQMAKAGKLNKCVRAGLRLLQVKDGKLAKQAKALEDRILTHGIKNALKRSKKM